MIKLVPEKNITQILIPELISADSKTVNLLIFESVNLNTNDTFDFIIEDDTILKFFKLRLIKQSNRQFSFDILSNKNITKRQYERLNENFEVSAENFSAKTLNISPTGMKIESKDALQIHSMTKVNIIAGQKTFCLDYIPLRCEIKEKKFYISGKFEAPDVNFKTFILQQNLKNKFQNHKLSQGGKNG